jgi:hypothetical protein
MRFVLIDHDLPPETPALLETACDRRGVAFERIHATDFAFEPDSGLAPGDMLYCAAVSSAAARVEQFLLHEDVASFHAEPLGAFFPPSCQVLLFQQLGLPTPRTVPLVTSDRSHLKAAVRAVGGLPVIVKALGGSGGVGVMRADTPAALYSLADLMVSDGRVAFLSAYVSPAVHWRVTVVGDRAVAAYRNIAAPDDFRTYASDDPEDHTDQPPAALARLAVAAVRALKLELGGVDILEHESGRLYLLEANFPCYFAQSQTVAGIDVAGAMVEHLTAKSRAILDGQARA